MTRLQDKTCLERAMEDGCAKFTGGGIRWHRWRFIGMFFAASAFVATALAQPQHSYPDRPIRFVVPLATGGAIDIAARLFGQKLAETFGQQIVIDNRPGAGGILGAELAAKVD